MEKKKGGEGQTHRRAKGCTEERTNRRISFWCDTKGRSMGLGSTPTHRWPGSSPGGGFEPVLPPRSSAGAWLGSLDDHWTQSFVLRRARSWWWRIRRETAVSAASLLSILTKRVTEERALALPSRPPRSAGLQAQEGFLSGARGAG